TMVFAHAFGERASLPALHPRGRYCHPVYAAALDRHVPADIGETIAAKHLARARHVFDVRESIIVMPATLNERGPADAETRVLLEPFEQVLEIVGLKRDVCVEAGDHVVGQPLHALEARVEARHLRRETAVALLRHSNEFDPAKTATIRLDDLVGTV